jgi:predicted transcriptional regulator
VINDIISKLHGVDLIAKTLGTENTLLKNNMSKLIKNTLLVLIKFGVKNIEKMSLATGIAKEELKKFLKMLIDEKRIKEDPEGIYSLV